MPIPVQEAAHAWSKTSPFNARCRGRRHPPSACGLPLATLVPGPTCPPPLGHRRWPARPDASSAVAMRPGHGLAHLPRLRTARSRCRAVGGPPAGSPTAAFPPLQRAQIVQLACLEPIAKGLHITHWSSADLARQAVSDGIVETISPRTVRQILHGVDLQPHRTRYWKTARLDAEFKERAERVLWCYGNAQRLAARGLWVVCVDEIPNLQILERRPIRRARPGWIEQQEFEYTRHGTVNVLVFLIVHTGRMELAIEPKKDAGRYVRELRAFRRRHRSLRGTFLIQDGDPSHTAAETAAYW